MERGQAASSSRTSTHFRSLVSIVGHSGLRRGQTSQACNVKILKGTVQMVEHNIAEIDGIVEDVLDRNGEESSKSCGVAG